MRIYYLLLFISVLTVSCSKDVMDKTVFIPDENDNNLPAYTEWGYNSFGAEYERDYFLVSNKVDPCKIIYNNYHQLQFLLNGTVRDGKSEMTLMFIFPLSKIVHYSDLILLNNMEIDLASNDCTVKIVLNGYETTLDVLEGKLHFKRTQLLSIDDEVNRVILSGTFDLHFLKNNVPSNISNGRFDLGITKIYSY